MLNDPSATARTVSRDGYLYTGDMGLRRDEQGLHFAGRAKWVMKPAGHQVFPGDVENHICTLGEKVAACGVVGVEHRFSPKPSWPSSRRSPRVELTVAELRRHAKGMASYMRPLHYVILEPGGMPLNRVAKSDYSPAPGDGRGSGRPAGLGRGSVNPGIEFSSVRGEESVAMRFHGLLFDSFDDGPAGAGPASQRVPAGSSGRAGQG